MFWQTNRNGILNEVNVQQCMQLYATYIWASLMKERLCLPESCLDTRLFFWSWSYRFLHWKRSMFNLRHTRLKRLHLSLMCIKGLCYGGFQDFTKVENEFPSIVTDFLPAHIHLYSFISCLRFLLSRLSVRSLSLTQFKDEQKHVGTLYLNLSEQF